VQHGERTAVETAAALGESFERIAEVIRELQRHYAGTWDPLRPQSIPRALDFAENRHCTR
jgi:hypothetical protein